ncbi:MAG TPA: hypothetical protein VKA38_09645 [Draconibacterium sp.]|nr:hypothetical protein [Draconibacterium sp.]
MKKQLKHITLWLLVVLAAPAVAQIPSLTSENTQSDLNRIDGKTTGVIYFITAEANNNFFLQKDWVTGIIELEDGTLFRNVRMRYQAHDDELIVYNNKQRTLFIIDKETVKSFTVQEGTRVHRFVKLYFDGFGKGERYFRELYDGTNKLLAFHFIDEVKINPYTDRYGMLRDKEYRPAVHYYLYNGKKGFSRLQMKRNSFLKVYPEHKKEVRKLFRKNHIFITGEEEMILAMKLLEESGIAN